MRPTLASSDTELFNVSDSRELEPLMHPTGSFQEPFFNTILFNHFCIFNIHLYCPGTKATLQWLHSGQSQVDILQPNKSK